MRAIEIDSQTLRAAAREMTGVSQDTDSTLQSFQSEIEALGQPWGDDDLGMVIGTVYQGVLAMVMNCLTSHLDLVDSLAERLGVAADDYDETDIQAAQQLNQIAGSASDPAI